MFDNISSLAGTLGGALILLVMIGVGCVVLAEQTGLNIRFLGLVGAGVGLAMIYKMYID